MTNVSMVPYGPPIPAILFPFQGPQALGSRLATCRYWSSSLTHKTIRKVRCELFPMRFAPIALVSKSTLQVIEENRENKDIKGQRWMLEG